MTEQHRSEPEPTPPPEDARDAHPPKLPSLPAEEVEMGGEPPCQLPRWWDPDDDEAAPPGTHVAGD